MVKILEMMGSSSSSASESDSNDEQIMTNGNLKPFCQYGTACYRKNPIHLRDFRHPSKNSAVGLQTNVFIEVNIEIGHKSVLADKNQEGHTHEWTAFVRGLNGQRIEYFIDKVTFQVNDQPLIFSEPPFSVTKSVNSSSPFTLPISIDFKSETKVTFDYTVKFNQTTSLECVRPEKIVFQNPTADFHAALLRGGGVIKPNLQMTASLAPSTSGSKRRKRNSGDATNNDESDIFGRLCSAKLRKVSPTQKIIAEKLISDVLFSAQMGRLTDTSCICFVQGVRDRCTNVQVKAEPVDEEDLIPTQRIKSEPVDDENDVCAIENVAEGTQQQ